MLVASDLAILLAGFVLAHAAWSVADLPRGELLVPLAVIEKGGQRQLLRFQSDTQEHAIAEGKATLVKRQADLDAWALGREGTMPEGSGKVDVLTVDAWSKETGRPVTFIQKFRPASSGGFRLLGDPIVVIDGKTVVGPEAVRLVNTLLDGVRLHPKAGQLWDRWRDR